MVLLPLQEVILSLLCISLLSVFILSLRVKRRNISKGSKKLIPSPPKLPFIGNIHQISSNTHQSLYSLSLKYGPLMLLHFGEVPCLVVSSSDMACSVMRTHDLTFATRPSAVVTDIVRFSDFAFEPYGEDWRQLKKIFTVHLMSPKRVASNKTIREVEVGNLIEKISSHAAMSSGEPIELSKILFSFMFDVVCRVVSGKFMLEKQRYGKIREVVKENSHLMGRSSFGDLFPSLSWLEGLIGLSRRVRRNKNRWDQLFEDLIQAHVQNEETNEGENTFLDILLTMKNDPTNDINITTDQIKGLLFDAFAAGVDTTFLTIEWALSELIKNPKCMKKVQEEVRSIAKHGDMVRSEELDQMSYLKAAIKESLRLHPPGTLLPREAMDECEINGYIIPKGTKLLVNAWAIGREAKSWDMPEEFRPERFIGSQVDYKGNDFQFIPFGAGRRICPAMMFGSAMVELALANLVYRFDWELPNGMTRDQFDMSELPGFNVHRKDDLRLLVKDIYVHT